MRALVCTLCIGLASCVEYEPGANTGFGPPAPDEVEDGFLLETFDGGGATTVDVIVVGDTSGSMEEELETLGRTITPFVERLSTYASDWRIAAVTSGSGCSASGVLGPDTPRYAEVFADALVQPIGDDDEAEMELRNVVRAIEKSGPGDCNEGLVRGGMLQVLFVSDENDESPGYDASPDYWRDYVDQMGEAHGDPSRVKISAVAGPAPFGCPGADPGFGFEGPVSVTGGEFLSICDDWASQIDLVADSAAVRSTFPLADLPVPDTIRVWLDDDALGEGAFSYDARANAVTLDAPARSDDTVSIEYQLAP